VCGVLDVIMQVNQKMTSRTLLKEYSHEIERYHPPYPSIPQTSRPLSIVPS
jgi:hypothetical protein